MTPFSAILVGDDTLLITCADLLRARGHRIARVITRKAEVADWARQTGLPVGRDPAELIGTDRADWLFSIANLRLLSAQVLACAKKGAVNFHDGPLPAYAGLNAPVWALLNGEVEHGVSWHKMEAGIDRGDLLAQQRFPIAEEDTALSLNGKCYAAAIESFEALLPALEAGAPVATPQDFETRSYFAKNKRPEGAGRLNFRKTTADIVRMVQALQFGAYWNPLTTPKLEAAHALFSVGTAESVSRETAAPGTVLEVTETDLTVSCADGAVRLGALHALGAQRLALPECLKQGDHLPVFPDEEDAALCHAHEAVAADDAFWRTALAADTPLRLTLARPASDTADWRAFPVRLGQTPLAAVRLWADHSAGPEQAGALAIQTAAQRTVPACAVRYLSDWGVIPSLPEARTKAALMHQTSQIEAKLDGRAGFAFDLPLRDPALAPSPIADIAISDGDAPLPGAALTVCLATGQLWADLARVEAEYAQILADRLTHDAAWLDQAEDGAALLPPLPSAELEKQERWNQTQVAFDDTLTVPEAIAHQADQTPQATAIVFGHDTITYDALMKRVDTLAQALAAAGAAPGDHIGLFLARGIDMVAGAIAIMKTGAAYVPLDPAYPAERITHYISDSAARIILTDSTHADQLPAFTGTTVLSDAVPATAAPFETRATPHGLAYLIYTSGSTGLPKGVMVTHRNVSNFFTGMDAEVDTTQGKTWAAVTSMAFDISVLELFYTLARGFKLVLINDDNRAAVSNGPIRLPGKKMDFNLFYWGNDDGVGRDKYALLLEGAKFADTHGFNAIWTPERHFHAFGGPYPNPSVTGAAVAAVTRSLSVRAGSCVAPLHHTARIAEEWAVIDNLTNGRAGLAIASGWQPDDFVLRPENTPPQNKPAMYAAIEDLRALWRGQAVSFPKADGTPHPVVTQPRPVSSELPIWVTTAGNPDTWREAGEIGANVLTHLLGQSIEEVAEKITIYHDALRNAGHDPEAFTVTLMLHTFLAEDKETARAIAREPMKDYLRSAAGLIKQYAWAFPAFKRPKGVANPFDMDLGSLSAEDLEAILDFAFERYFEDSGLFGTVEDALARVDALKRIGVTEVACLIDYGIAVPTVLEGLRPLARVLAEANAAAELSQDDVSLAAQLIRHEVSHLQCTPSMAQIIALNEEARLALAGVRQILLGGEALPGALVRDLRGATNARFTNMYGPTETTIWSSYQRVTDGSVATVPIGAPIANTCFHLLDAAMQPVPIGVPGELHIGGDGVTDGYWQRPELTAQRFVASAGGDTRLYKTGDLVCRHPSGQLDFLGRNDGQIKIRGQRIELGEIEAALTDLTNVSQAVVIPVKAGNDDLALAAYVTGDLPADTWALRQALAATLPEAMLPASITVMEAFPLTPNRKIDRKALPEPRALAPAKTETAPVAPPVATDGTAQKIAQIWSRILGLSQIGAEDNFFAIGGHSLLAVQAHREIRETLDRPDLSITDIFRFPTLAGLAAHLDGAGEGSADPVQPKIHAPARGEVMSKRKAMRANRAARVD